MSFHPLNHRLRSVLLTMVLIFSQLLDGVAFAADNPTSFVYKIFEGEDLSTILYRFGISPIYGKTGSIEKTLLLNPKLRMGYGSWVRPGQKIQLPFREESELTPDCVIVQRSGNEVEIRPQYSYLELKRFGRTTRLVVPPTPSLPSSEAITIPPVSRAPAHITENSGTPSFSQFGVRFSQSYVNIRGDQDNGTTEDSARALPIPSVFFGTPILRPISDWTLAGEFNEQYLIKLPIGPCRIHHRPSILVQSVFIID